MVELTFLGTANAFGHGGRRRSHYLIQGSKTCLIDAGYDTLAGLRSLKMTVEDIDYIFLSHLHPDHYLGIPQMSLENYYVIKREKPIKVYCPLDTKDTILEATAVLFDENVTKHINELFEFIELPEGKNINFEGGSLETIYAEHSANARMQIIELDEKTIGYSGDSSFVEESFLQLLECDITITEASSAFHTIPKHTSLQDLLDANIPSDNRVYISHVGEDVIDAKDKIEPPLYLANDGMKVEI